MAHDYYTTYEQLKTWINHISPEQLRQTVTVYFEETKESYPISGIRHMEDGQAMLSVDPKKPS